MPGPVSESYRGPSPEFQSREEENAVRSALECIRSEISSLIGDELKYIGDVATHPDENETALPFLTTERELRLIRYAINTALECI